MELKEKIIGGGIIAFFTLLYKYVFSKKTVELSLNFIYKLFNKKYVRAKCNEEFPLPHVVKKFENIYKGQILFIYGSFLDPKCLFKIFTKTSRALEYIPALLKNYTYTWGMPSPHLNLIGTEWQTIDKKQGNIQWESLIIEEASSKDHVQGALLQVTDAEMKEIEKHLNKSFVSKEVTINVSLKQNNNENKFKNISTFIPRNTDRLFTNNISLAVSEKYVKHIKHLLKLLGFKKPLFPLFGFKKPLFPEHSNYINAFETDIHFKNFINSKKQRKRKIIESHNALEEYLSNSNCKRLVGGVSDIIPTSLIPIVLSKKMYSQVEEVAKTSLILTSKALKIMLSDNELCKKAGYGDDDIKLAKASIPNISLQLNEDEVEVINIPAITRVDMILNKENIFVCEVNTCSPAGTFHFDKTSAWQIKLCNDLGMEKILSFNKVKETCAEVINVIKQSWENYCKHINEEGRRLKRIAILEINWDTLLTKTEIIYYKEKIISNLKGVDVEILEPRDLTFNNGKIIGRHGQIDLVYSRLPWKDLKENDHTSALFEAVLNNSICVVNDMRSILTGNKFFLALLQQNEFKSKFSATEQNFISKHFPKTRVWNNTYNNKYEVCQHNDDFVLKSFFGYGSTEVVMKVLYKAEGEYKKHLDKKYIVQDLCKHGRVLVPTVKDHELCWKYNNFILGVYIVGGECVGIEAKVSETVPISMHADKNHTISYRTLVLPTKT